MMKHMAVSIAVVLMALAMSSCTLTPPPPVEPAVESRPVLWVPNDRRWFPFLQGSGDRAGSVPIPDTHNEQ